jgi:hypothetical protein
MITAEVWLHSGSPPPASGTWIAVGSHDTINRSVDDGLTWAQIIPTAGSGLRFSSIAHDGTSWMIGGDNEVWTSPDDGLTFTRITPPAAGMNFPGWDLLCSPEPGVFLIGCSQDGLTNTWRTTNQGASWTNISLAAFTSDFNYFNDMASNGAGVVTMVTQQTIKAHKLLRSTDSGVTFSLQTITTDGSDSWSTSFANGFWVIGLGSSNLAYSTNAATGSWTQYNLAAPATNQISKTAWDGTYYWTNSVGGPYLLRTTNIAGEQDRFLLSQDMVGPVSNGNGVTILLTDAFQRTTGALSLTTIQQPNYPLQYTMRALAYRAGA